jgi:hypothetical protein
MTNARSSRPRIACVFFSAKIPGRSRAATRWTASICRRRFQPVRALQARQSIESEQLSLENHFSKQWPNHSFYHLMVNPKIGDDAVVETIVRAMQCHDRSWEMGHE